MQSLNVFKPKTVNLNADISKIIRSPWEMLHIKHQLNTLAVSPLETLLQWFEIIPSPDTHLSPLSGVAAHEREAEGCVHASAATFHNPTS